MMHLNLSCPLFGRAAFKQAAANVLKKNVGASLAGGRADRRPIA